MLNPDKTLSDNTLIDSFGRRHTYLRVSVTDRCNLRCTYCMPKEGLVWKKRQELTTFEEIVRLSRIFVGMGVDKIRLTGGEPMVRKGFPDLVQELGRLDGLKTLAMTTNATLLAAHAEELKRSGMTHLNISLDTFKAERFQAITRQDESLFHTVRQGIDAALDLNFASVKINMVVMAGVNCDEILDFVAFAAARPVNVRFIEYMPFKDNQWTNEKVVTYKDMLGQIEERYTLKKLQDDPSAVGKDYDIVDGVGSISFISSMSDSFCASCNRLRLTADGSIKSCLFYPAETNLRDAMRQGATDEQLQGMILDSLRLKPEAHPPAEEIAAQDNRAMIQIGG